MLSLGLAVLAFVPIHLGISGTALRDALVARLGLRGYMLAFSVLLGGHAHVVGVSPFPHW